MQVEKGQAMITQEPKLQFTKKIAATQTAIVKNTMPLMKPAATIQPSKRIAQPVASLPAECWYG
jgi:hypothetical protein